jgi:hypothetical protein
MYTPEMRQGDFLNYMLEVQPTSMAKPDPNMKVQHLLQFCTNVIPAAAQAVQILGPAFKIDAFLERVASEIGLEEFDEIIDAPTFREWILTKLVSELDPAKAGAFATQAPINSQPWEQGGQQMAIKQQIQQMMANQQKAQAAAQPKTEPPKVSVSINWKDASPMMQEQLEQLMGLTPQQEAPPAAAQSAPVKVNPGQPNPHARGRSTQNVNVGTESAQAQQQVAGQLQRAFPTDSAQARSLNLGS